MKDIVLNNNELGVNEVFIYREKEQEKRTSRNQKKNMERLKLFNSSSLNFNLREPNKNKSTNIYAVIKIGNKQIKIATELKINSWQWDKKKQIPIIDNRTNKEERENLIYVFNILYDFRFAFLNFFYIFA